MQNQDKNSAAEAAQPASTDLQQLKELALAADPISTDLYGDRYMQGAWSRVDLDKEQDDFITAITPAVVLDLIARIEQEREVAMSWRRIAEREGQARIERAAAPAPTAWEYCPECGSLETAPPDENVEHQYFCAACGQEWHSDIDYTDVVRGNLGKRAASPAVSAATKPAPLDLPQVPDNIVYRIGAYGNERADNDPKSAATFGKIITDIRSLLATKPAAQAEPVGTLSVFPDKEATWGFSYDISTNHTGHMRLQKLDGATLYVGAAPLSADAAQEQARNDALEEAATACHCLVKNRRPVYARDCVEAIRALKRPAAGAEGAA